MWLWYNGDGTVSLDLKCEDLTMRCVKLIIAAIIVCVVFSSCNILGIGQPEYFGFKTSSFAVIEESDTHGGFHGDGYYYLILDCSENREQAMELIEDWKQLPLTENLQIIMYGGEKDGISYAPKLPEEAHWPIISNGVYKFVDRYSEFVADRSDDAKLFDRHSYNFSVAVYDFDTDKLYYFEFDT
jgi:hypothetical protein